MRQPPRAFTAAARCPASSRFCAISRRASGVMRMSSGPLAGPKWPVGVRTSKKGSSLVLPLARGAGATATGCGALGGAAGDAGGAPLRALCAFAGGAFAAGAGLLEAAPALPAITATAVPTGTVWPAGTRISASTPASVASIAMATLSVSISNSLSPIATASPTDLNQLLTVPSATVSPSCGIKTSISLPSSRAALPLRRDVLRLEEFGHAFAAALAADAARLDAAEGRRRIGDDAAIEADHAEFELLRHFQAALDIAGIE